MSASTTCPFPLRLRSNKAKRMPMTHIAPPPAKSARSARENQACVSKTVAKRGNLPASKFRGG